MTAVNDFVDICHTLLVGMSQSGKTTYTIRYLLRCIAACRFIFDDLPGKKSFAFKLGMRPCYTQRDCEVALKSRWVIFNPSRAFPDDYAAAFDWFCRWVFHCAQRGGGLKVLVVDELWQWADARQVPKALRRCTQAGAEYGIQLFTSTQEPHRVNSSIIGQATELVCFKLQEPKAWDYIAGLGADPKKVAALPRGSFLSYDRQFNTVLPGRVF